MLIDVSTYVGHWPFRKVDGATLNELAPVLAEHKITHAIVSNVNGIFYKDAMEGNLELYEELKNYKGEVEFIPFAVINPSYINWREDMEKCVKELGFKGFDFTPAYHKHVLGEVCTLSDPCYKEAFKFAGELGVPVRVENEYENFRQHHWMESNLSPTGDQFADMLSASDKTTLIIGGYFPDRMGARMAEIVKTRKNVFFNTRRLDPFYDACYWQAAVNAVGCEHLVFGTNYPFTHIGPAEVALTFAPQTEEEKQAIMSENIRGYLGL